LWHVGWHTITWRQLRPGRFVARSAHFGNLWETEEQANKYPT
jgi:hypothetical protein